MTISKALTKSLISYAGQGNVDAVDKLSAQLPAEQQKAVKKILSEMRPQDTIQDRIIELFQGNSPFYRILDVVPDILAYLSPQDNSRAAGVDSLFLSQASPNLYGLMTRTNFFLGDLAAPRQVRTVAALGNIARLNFKQSYLNVSGVVSQTLSRIKPLMPQILSYLTIREIVKIARCNRLFKNECYSSVLSLTHKTSSSYVALHVYKELFGLDTPLNVLQLNPRQANCLTALSFAGTTSVHQEDNVTVEALPGILNMCPNLTSIGFSAARIFNLGILPDIIRDLSQRCPHIRAIDVAQLTISAHHELPNIGLYFPGLQSINLRWTAFNEDDFTQFVKICAGLKKINLRGINGQGVTDSMLNTLAANCRQLEDVELSANYILSEAGIIAFLERCPHLISVDLSLTKVTDATIEALVKHCPQLKHVVLGGSHFWASVQKVSDAGIVSLLKGCPKLESLDVSNLHFTGAVLQGLAEFGSNLIDVNLTNIVCLDKDYLVNRKAFRAFLHKASNLKKVVFTNAHTDNFFRDAIRDLLKWGVKIELGSMNTSYYVEELQRIFAYRPKTLLGKLYQAVTWHFVPLEEDIAEIKTFLNQIDKPFRDRIFFHVWDIAKQPKGSDNWGELHALDSLVSLDRALIKSLKGHLDSLSNDEKNRVYGNIYRLAGSPDTDDPEWGKTHCFDDMSRLADAIVLEAK